LGTSIWNPRTTEELHSHHASPTGVGAAVREQWPSIYTEPTVGEKRSTVTQQRIGQPSCRECSGERQRVERHARMISKRKTFAPMRVCHKRKFQGRTDARIGTATVTREGKVIGPRQGRRQNQDPEEKQTAEGYSRSDASREHTDTVWLFACPVNRLKYWDCPGSPKRKRGCPLPDGWG
jgi:hypothetical protein